MSTMHAPTLPRDVTSLSSRLEQRLRAFGEGLALIDGETRWSYSQLLAAAEAFGDQLGALGVGQASPVIINLSRGQDLIRAVTACTLRGLPWLVINPDWSEAKQEAVIRLVRPQAIISKGLVVEVVNAGNGRRLGAEVAYLATSSGSSGDLKCAVIPASGLFALMTSQSEKFALTPGMKVLQAASPGFDAVVSEIMVSFWGGATLVIPQATDLTLVPAIEGLISAGLVHLVTLTPSVARLLKPATLLRLQTLVLAGEAADPALVAPLLGKVRVLNAYGPCEVSVCSHMHEVTDAEAVTCIGEALPHVKTRVVDEFGNDVIPEGSGELWLYGDAVGLGYLEGGGERFSSNPTTGVRCYRTGDVVRLSRDGKAYFVGRQDNQIKVRGQKVHLGEVVAAARAVPGVEAAEVVHVPHSSQQQIVLFYSGTAESPRLQDELKCVLASVALPKRVIHLRAIPLNANGKADLPQLKVLATNCLAEQDAPAAIVAADPAIAQAQEVWREVLSTTAKTETDDFFDAGGDSLMIVAMFAKFQEMTGREFPLEPFIQSPNFKTLVELIRGDVTAAVADETPESLATSSWRTLVREVDAWPLIQSQGWRPLKKVVLTGATGKVGRAMLQTLLRETDATVICLGRRPVPLAETTAGADRVAWVQADLGDRKALGQVLADLAKTHRIDAVVHGAAAVNHVYSFADLYAVNVAATVQLLTLARVSAARFVYLSSLSGAAPGQVGATGYEQTKGASEQLVSSARSRGLDATILRLPLVYDLEAATQQELTRDHFLSRVQECLTTGMRPLLDAQIPAISASDCAAITVALAQDPAKLAGDYDLLNDDGAGWDELFDALGDSSQSVAVASYSEWRKQFLARTDKASPLRVFASLYQDGAPYAESMVPSLARNQEATARLRAFVSGRPSLSVQPSQTILLEALNLLRRDSL